MHIGIDAHAIGSQQGGNETYIRNLISALAEIDRENLYTLYFTNRQVSEEWRGRYDNFKVRLLPPPTPLVRMPVALAFELRRRPVDILHVQFTAPPFCAVPVIATIHDLAFEHHPETFTRRGRTQLKLTVRRTARRAAHLLTVSEFSRQDIARTYRLSPYKITVTPNGVEPQFTSTPENENEAESVRQRFGIERDYLLAVGSIQPRKNLVRLLKAYQHLREKHSDFKHQLVIAGRHLWLYKDILGEIERQPWRRDVITTGYVNHEDLPALYRSATALVYPSIFEGFGLPPLEAMACGTPVITSKTSSLPEVVGEAGLLINPHSETDIAQAILKVVKDEQKHEEMRQLGLIQASYFNWRSSAQKTLQIYRKVATASFNKFVSEISGQDLP